MADAWLAHSAYIDATAEPIQQWLMERLDPNAGGTYLDLGAGPGSTSMAIAEKAGSSGKVITSDLVPEMVEVARRRIQSAGFTNVDYQVIDAQKIGLPDGSVDGATFRFGLMLVPDAAVVCREVLRVLRPGGKFTLATWAGPDRNPWVSIIGLALAQHGKSPGGNPFEPGGLFSLSQPEVVRDLLKDSGFIEVKTDIVATEMPASDFDEYWSRQLDLAAPLKAVFSSLSDEQAEEVKQSGREMAASFIADDGRASFPAEAVCGFGVKP